MTDRRPYTAKIGMDALVERADGSTINFGDAIYHPENEEEAREYALAASEPSDPERLHEAWAAAEAALPDDHVLAELRRYGDSWAVSTDNVTPSGRSHWSAIGQTPAAALRALAARLTDTAPETTE